MLTFNRLGASSLMKLDNNSPLAATHKISDTINPLIDMVQNDAVNIVFPTTSPAAPVPPAVTNTCSRTSAHATAHSAALRDDSDQKSASLQSQIDYEIGDGQYDIHDHIRRGHEYNQHYPPGKGHPSTFHQPESPQKFIEWDYSVGRGNMKILSRTLFVSGTAAEAQLRSIFEQFGSIQSCVVNSDRCHAFIKMISRQDAVKARTEAYWYDRDGIQIRTRWGNGFGPRYCNDYRTGVSVIPLKKLTRGDRKWLLTAEHGGTGGLPLKAGMVVEEPDIEIGAGLSSKSLSRTRTATRSKYRGFRK